MRVVKKYLTFSLILLIYVSAMAILMQQFFIYRKAYRQLCELISHPTIEVTVSESTEGE